MRPPGPYVLDVCTLVCCLVRRAALRAHDAAPALHVRHVLEEVEGAHGLLVVVAVAEIVAVRAGLNTKLKYTHRGRTAQEDADAKGLLHLADFCGIVPRPPAC